MKPTILWREDHVLVTLGIETSFSEINGLNGRLIGDSRFETIKYQLWDFTNTKEMVIREIKDMKIIAELDKVAARWNPDLKVAIVAQQESVVKELSNYVNSMDDSDWETKIFPDVASAVDWAVV